MPADIFNYKNRNDEKETIDSLIEKAVKTDRFNGSQPKNLQLPLF